MRTLNNDTGSLLVGDITINVGDLIQIEGEKNLRKVTYLMGQGAKQHACCKGTGPFPVGAVEFIVIGTLSALEAEIKRAVPVVGIDKA